MVKDDALVEPQHEVVDIAQRLKECSRSSLEAVLLAAIVSQKMAVEDLRLAA